MRILLLSDCNSVHTIRWANSLVENNLEVVVFSLSNQKNHIQFSPEVIVYSGKIRSKLIESNSTNAVLKLLNYTRTIPHLKRIIKEFKPDILHAHYASSYGLLGAASGFHPFCLSVWGSDVFSFPENNFLNKKLLQVVLKRTDKIFSTSHTMAEQCSKYTDKSIQVIPFGIELSKYEIIERQANKDELTIGTIKSLNKIYGVEYLIRAFNLLVRKNPGKKLKLNIVGDGEEKQRLISLAGELGIREKVIFSGYIPYNKVPACLSKFDIFAALSLFESFGVAIVEASAAKLPVVVSDAGGIPEVVDDNSTGFVVPVKDIESAAVAFQKLIESADLRKEMGENGFEKVKIHYQWKDNVKLMISSYQKIADD